MLTGTAGIIVGVVSLRQFAERTGQAEEDIVAVVRLLPPTVDTATKVLDVHLGKVNTTLDKTARALTLQTGSVQRDLSRTLVGVDRTTAATEKLALDFEKSTNSLDAVISDPDIPALVRDLRITAAQTGVTMSHVRSLTNTLAQAAPQMASSSNSVAAASAGVAQDVHKLTSDMTKPRPWYQKALAYLSDAVKIGAIF